jgi:hypothetical protein
VASGRTADNSGRSSSQQTAILLLVPGGYPMEMLALCKWVHVLLSSMCCYS